MRRTLTLVTQGWRKGANVLANVIRRCDAIYEMRNVCCFDEMRMSTASHSETSLGWGKLLDILGESCSINALQIYSLTTNSFDILARPTVDACWHTCVSVPVTFIRVILQAIYPNRPSKFKCSRSISHTSIHIEILLYMMSNDSRWLWSSIPTQICAGHFEWKRII